MRKLKNNELNRISKEEFKQSKKIPLVIVLDNVRSMHNIGSVFRTSDAFLINKIYLCGITAIPPNKEIHKTALGAQDSMDWEYKNDTNELVINLKQEGYIIVSAEQTEGSVKLPDFKIEKENKYALIFGNEVKGVQQEVVSNSDICLEIPQYGTKHSFNISVSVGIILWEFSKIFYYHLHETQKTNIWQYQKWKNDIE